MNHENAIFSRCADDCDSSLDAGDTYRVMDRVGCALVLGVGLTVLVTLAFVLSMYWRY